MAEEKNLPIKIFEKRKEDEMLTEAGGGPEPKWVKHGSELRELAIGYTTALKEAEKVLSERVKRDSYIPVVLNAEINENLLAANRKP